MKERELVKEYALRLAYKKQKEWAKAPMWWEMSIGAIGGGLFIISLACQFTLGALIGFLITLIGKGILLLADLGRPERFVKVLSRPKDSWISKGAWGFMLFAVAGGISILPLIISGLAWTPWTGGGKTSGIVAGVLAGFLMIYEGFFLADSRGIEFWNDGSLPIVFVSSGAVGGMGALLVLTSFSRLNVTPESFVLLNMALLLTAGVSLYSFMYSAHKRAGGAKRSAEELTNGRLSSIFWTAGVVAGIVVPLCSTMVALLGVPIPAAGWAITGLLEIVGVIAWRYCILNAGVYSPVM